MVNRMSKPFYGPLFTFCQRIVRVFFPKFTVERQKRPSGEPVVYVSHHQNLFGPFMTLLWYPEHIHCWMLHVFMERKACYNQYVNYTFTKRFGWPKFLAIPLAFLMALFIPRLLQSGKGIPVYRGSRKIIATIRESVEKLKACESIIIFPDIDYADSSAAVKKLYEGFLFLEKYYFQETGKHLAFVPLYVSKKKRKIIASEPLYFSGEKPFRVERKEIIEKIQDRLNELAVECGDHEE